MDSRLLMTLQVTVGGAQRIGAVPHGTGLLEMLTGRKNGHRPDARWLPICKRLFGHESLDFGASTVLAAMRTDEAVDVLLARLPDVSADNLYSYLQTLGATESPRIVPAMLAGLERAQPGYRGMYYVPLLCAGNTETASALDAWLSRTSLDAGEKAYVQALIARMRRTAPGGAHLHPLLATKDAGDRDWVLAAFRLLGGRDDADKLEAWATTANLPEAESARVQDTANTLRLSA